jgi:hypothetical protein
MKYDEQLQLELLQMAVDAWPQSVDITQDLLDRYESAEIAGMLLYLAQHGLIKTGTQVGIGGFVSFGYWEITQKGVDFMHPTGGLGALLNVVTVKLHEDSIKELMIKRIEQSDGDVSVKGELIKQVKALPAEGLKAVAAKAFEAGLAALPNAIPLFHLWLASHT